MPRSPPEPDLRPETKVVDVMRDGSGGVSGVVARRRGETTERLHANLVIGADGRNSAIAKLVDAS